MNTTEFNYNGFIVRPRTVLGETGDRIAFEILNSEEQILGIYANEERAKKRIDQHGKRWLKMNLAIASRYSANQPQKHTDC